MNFIYELKRDKFYKVYDVHNSSVEYSSPKDENKICRYCSTSNPNKFKSKAHLIPEFTGNKEVFCNNECDL